MTEGYAGFETFVDTGTRTYTFNTDEPEAQYLTQEMLSDYIQAVSTATTMPHISSAPPFQMGRDYVYQGSEWQPFPEPHEYWAEVEVPPINATLRDMYPPRREPEGPGIETISMIGFR